MCVERPLCQLVSRVWAGGQLPAVSTGGDESRVRVPGELRPDGQLGHRDADVSGLVGRIPRAKASPACVGRPSPSEAPLPGVGTESQWAGWGDGTPSLPSGAASEALPFPQAGRGGPGPAQRRPARARRSSCCSGRRPPSCCGSSRKWGSSAPRCALCAVCSSAASGRRPPHTGTPMLSSPCSPPLSSSSFSPFSSPSPSLPLFFLPFSLSFLFNNYSSVFDALVRTVLQVDYTI